jgi:hypothetical protein
MATMPAGMVAGRLVLGRLASPAQQIRMPGWLAVLSFAPLTCSLVQPPLWLLVPLWDWREQRAPAVSWQAVVGIAGAASAAILALRWASNGGTAAPGHRAV